MSALPQGWEEASLLEIGMPSTTKVNPEKFQSDTFELFSVPSYSDDQPEICPGSEIGSTKQEVQPGDVLLCKIVPHINRVWVVPEKNEYRQIASSEWIIIRNSQCDPKYLRYCLYGPDFRQVFLQDLSGIGGSLTRARPQTVQNIKIPIPPFNEQCRIVAKLDSIFARTSRAREELEHIPRLVEHYKQAILAAAFRGDLTTGMLRQDKVGVHEVTPLWETPTDWHWKYVAQIGDVSLGRQRSPKNHQGPDMRPYVRAANITWSGWDLSDVKTMNFNESDFSRFVLCDGDVLLNEGSGSAKEVGKPAIWRGQIKDCCFQNTLLRVQPQECSSEYLYWYFMYCAISGRFARETQGVNIHHIGKAGLANIAIPCPSPTEQSMIVARIESNFSRLTKLIIEHVRATNLLSKFEQAMLSKAFRGELVPQDPNDEPASVLLERIQAERENIPTSKRSNRKYMQENAA